jgi:hypothetical protein
VSNSESNSQLGLWPLALGDNRHDARPYLTCCQFEGLVRRALFVIEVVIAVVFEDGLRHDGVALVERRRSVEDFASSVGHNVGFSVLDAHPISVLRCHARIWCCEWKRGLCGKAYPLCILLQDFVRLQHLYHQSAPIKGDNLHCNQLAWSISSGFGTLKSVTRFTYV